MQPTTTPRQREQKKEQKKRARARAKAWIREYKLQHGCVDCGYNKHPDVLEFDHLPDKKKSFELSDARWRTITAIKKEVAKCEVVCANCHRLRTYTRREQGGRG
jgi:hypothetical protein